jgi:hypothetical protein
MKVIIAKKHFKAKEGFISRGDKLRLPDHRAEVLVKKGLAVYKEHNIKMPVITYEQSGSWFTVFKDGKKIDKLQGKDKLKERYAIEQANDTE